jgi:predicted transporter
MKRFLATLPLVIPAANAQCVMCFRTAAAQNMERAKVMNTGIIIMLIPPVLILAGFLYLCYRRNQSFTDQAAGETSPSLSEPRA